MRRWLIAAAVTGVATTGFSEAPQGMTTQTVRPLQGEPAVWIDNANLPVMVGGGQYGSMATIDNVCPR